MFQDKYTSYFNVIWIPAYLSSYGSVFDEIVTVWKLSVSAFQRRKNHQKRIYIKKDMRKTKYHCRSTFENQFKMLKNVDSYHLWKSIKWLTPYTGFCVFLWNFTTFLFFHNFRISLFPCFVFFCVSCVFNVFLSFRII